MPFTPYHFGPGLLLKTALQQRFSFTAFVATNVVIDVETLFYLVTRQCPVHRLMHSFAGSTVTALAVTAVLLLTFKWLASTDLSRLWDVPPSWIEAEFTSAGVAVGAVLAALSHTILDSILHGDVRPLAPFTTWNPFLGLVGAEALHIGCILAGAAAIGVAGFQSRVAKQAG